MNSSKARTLIATFAITSALAPLSRVRAAPTSVYNGTAFTSAPTTPIAGAGAGIGRSGAYSHSFAFEVPPGRLGQHPNLALTYRSDGPIYGTIAAGWSLDLPTIELDTKDGILQPERRWLTSLSGGERLLPSDDPRGPDVEATYRARHDISNIRYEKLSASAAFQWQARSPDGILYRFGRRDADAPVDKLATLAETVDAHGNTVTYDWVWPSRFQPGRFKVWSPRLDSIRYTSNATAKLPPFATVSFSYDIVPPCAPGGSLPIGSHLSNRTGAPIIHGEHRLRTVTTSTVDRSAAGGKVRRYELLYDAEAASCNRDGAPRRQLAEIHTSAWSPDGQEITVAPVVFGYEPDPGNYHELWEVGRRETGALRAEASGNVDVMLTDMDGDGLPDRVVANGGDDCDFYWQRNLGNGFDEARVHVRRPRLPYGSVPDDWRDPFWPNSNAPAQGCSLNRQRTLLINISGDLDELCENHGNHVRSPSLVSWRFLDVDHDGLNDMVAAIDANVASLNPLAVQFESVSWNHFALSRRSLGSFAGEIRALQTSANHLACSDRRPFEADDRFPWLVFRNVGFGRFSDTPEVLAMPVPLMAANASGRSKVGEEQAGPHFNEFFWSDSFSQNGATGATHADPFALADIDGDGYQDLISSFKSAEELDGGEPARYWKVLRGGSDGLFRGVTGDTPFDFGSAPHSHANGILAAGTLRFDFQDGSVALRSLSASTSGLYDAHGDGLPDFLWSKTETASGPILDWTTTGRGLPNMGSGMRDCDTPESCAFFLTWPDTISHGGFSNLISRSSFWGGLADLGNGFTTSWTSDTWIDVDGDGRQDLVTAVPKLSPSDFASHEPPRVRYSDGEGLLAPRPLPAFLSRAVTQRDITPAGLPIEFPRLQTDIDGDGRLDTLINHIRNNDSNDDGLIDGTDIPYTDNAQVWSVFRTPHRPKGLLTRITSSQGATTHIEYASVRDEWVVRGWKLPTHAWVTSTVSVDAGDGSPLLISRYEYGTPVWNRDLDNRWGFRGFGSFVTVMPSGSRTESRVTFDQFYAGLAQQTVTFERVDGANVPRSVATMTWRNHGSADNPLFVQRQNDARTCSSAEPTVESCLSTGTLKRTVMNWSWHTAAGSSEFFLLPDQEIEVAGTDTDAPGARSAVKAYVLIATGTDYRIRLQKSASSERTPASWQEFSFHESIHDPTLKRVVQSRDKIDDSRVATTRFIYDDTVGVVLGVELPESFANNLNEVSSIGYDAHKVNAVTTVNAAGHIATKAFDLGSGAVLRTAGPQYRCPIIGVPCTDPYRKYRETVLRYDGFGRLVSRSESVDSGPVDYQLIETERHAYQDYFGLWPSYRRAVNETRIDKAANSAWTRRETTADGLGRTVREVTSTFNSTIPDAVRTFHFDHRGLATDAFYPDPSRNDGSLVSNHYTYDGLGRTIAISHSSGLGGVRRISRDGMWTETRLDTADNGPAARVRYLTDVFGKIVRVEERTGVGTEGPPAVTEYGYDPNGHLASVLDADGIATTLGNDRMGSRLWIERGGQRWDYSYDLQGRVKTATVPHPAGQATAYTSSTDYDAIGRIWRHTPGPGALTPTEQSELGLGAIDYTYDTQGDTIGLPGRVTSPAWIEDFDYDAAGLATLVSQRLTIAGAPSDTRTVTSQYNAMGSPLQQVHADGTLVSYTYDRRGLPATAAVNGTLTLSDTRNTSALVTRRMLTVGTTNEAFWTYDPLGNLLDQVVRLRPPGMFIVTAARQTHTYFASGDVKRVVERIASSYRTYDYTYDHQSQLRVAQDNRGYRGVYDFTPNGRLLAADVDLPTGADLSSRDVIYDYDDLDPERLRTLVDRQTGADVVRLAHDLSGNTIAKTSSTGTGAFKYDAAGKLRLAIRGAERERYYYDANGRRIFAMRTNGGTFVESRRIVDDLEIETLPTGTQSRLTVSAGTPFARVVSGNADREMLFQNASGNLLVAADRRGLLAGFSYGAFGEILEQQLQTSRFERRYQDRERDTITGWYDYGVRLYDPETMLWNRSDPLYRFAPDAASTEPRRLGLYTFSLNNPLRYIDADGRDPQDNQMNWIPDDCMFGNCHMRAEMAQQAINGARAAAAAAQMIDVTGISDYIEITGHLSAGDYGAAMEGAAWVGASAAAGWGLGKVIGAGARLARRLARSSDEMAAIVARSTDDIVEGAALGWDDDVIAEAIPRSGAREVLGQGVGTTRCAPTCVRMVTETLGRKADDLALKPFVDAADAQPGLHVPQIVDALKAQGFERATSVVGSGALERVTSRGTPVITIMNARGSRHTHAIVVDGITSLPGVGKVVAIRDPGGAGRQFFLPYARFFQKWTLDVILPLGRP